MFYFDKCTYEEFQRIRNNNQLILSGWEMLDETDIADIRLIYSNDEFVGLINYYYPDNEKDYMIIALFEVIGSFRNKGFGKRIIKDFLKDYSGIVSVEPSSEETELFWEKCGFVDNYWDGSNH